ncbi:MAG TPA: metal-sulfur cluster assembly factor [Segeticoccus sp.]|uniref:metal-sulfur cluster assembly factor n=1 Tax=Segeticoccus sp. TaxID=2706531 RepID=UPI002D80C261|nr:metal-sulfur cluster assembly factor [Segeticoccus sp.]HET8599475.1 metal-sulfur cluster assembly factor [Segeticoccus sp.]
MSALSVTSWLGGENGPALVQDLLAEVIDPELGLNIVDLGLVYGLSVDAGLARITMTMTTPGCPLTAYFNDEIRGALWGVPGIEDVEVEIVWEPPWAPAMMSDAGRSALGWPA